MGRLRMVHSSASGIRMCRARDMLSWMVLCLMFLGFVSGSAGRSFTGSRMLQSDSLEAQAWVGEPSAGGLSPAKADSSKSVKSHLWVYLVGCGAGVLLITALVVLAVVYVRQRRRTTAVSPWKSGMSGHLQKAFETTVPSLSRGEMEKACEDFSNIIGSSADSVVYKGTLSSGTEVAAASIRVSGAVNWTPQAELSFRRTVEALARMKHGHLVNLVAYCAEEDPFTRMLIFEYASNGTLFDHLHNKESEHLDWQARMRVVMGAAYGLEYMHHDLIPPASHLNFDSSAVYLTDDYAAKIANFGVTKVPVIRSERHPRANWMGQRAIGYNDLEGSDRHCPDFESNMYSFGVFLLETITGRPPHSELEGSLVDWATEYLSDPKMVWYIVDPMLKSHNHDELVGLCKIISLCLSLKPSKRPSMRRVTQMLAESLNMSPQLAGPRASPLLWAQLEILQDDSSTDLMLP